MEIKDKKKFIPLKDLEVYQLARELSQMGWQIYTSLDWHTKKIMGDQFITAADSFGANIAEGYGRFHYLDKIKFFYIARASLIEATEHWFELLRERGKIQEVEYHSLKKIADKSAIKLQNFITAIYKVRNAPKQ